MLKQSKLLDNYSSPTNIRAFQIQFPYTKSHQNPPQQVANHASKENLDYLYSIDTKRSKICQSPINSKDLNVKANTKADSLMSNGRLEEIKRKYESQTKRDRVQIKQNILNPLKESNRLNFNQEPSTEFRKERDSLSLTPNRIKQKNPPIPLPYDPQNLNARLPEFGVNLNSEMKQSKQKQNNFQQIPQEIKIKYSSRPSEKCLREQIRQLKPSTVENQNKYKFGKIQRNEKNQPTKNIEVNRIQYIPHTDKSPNSHQKPKAEHRIDSIDKINLKIKQILKCLNQNQKKSYNYEEQQHTTKQFNNNRNNNYISPQYTSNDYRRLLEQSNNNSNTQLNKSKDNTSIRKNNIEWERGDRDRDRDSSSYYKNLSNKDFYNGDSIRSKNRNNDEGKDYYIRESYSKPSFHQQQQPYARGSFNNNAQSRDYRESRAQEFGKESRAKESFIRQLSLNKQSKIYGNLKNSFAKDIFLSKQLPRQTLRTEESYCQKVLNKDISRRIIQENNFEKERSKEDVRRESIYEKYSAPRFEQKKERCSSVMTKPRQVSTSNECKLKSGKDLDEQIRKIQQKIRKSEEQKRKLNIKFEVMKEYTFKDRSGSMISHNQPKKTTNGFNQIEQTQVSHIFPQDIQIPRPLQKNYKKIEQRMSLNEQETRSSKSNLNNLDGELKTSQIVNQRERSITNKMDTRRPQKSIYQIPKSTRVTQHNLEVIVPKIQTKRMIESLTKQVSLDEQLRNGKLMLSIMKDSVEKWQQVVTELSKHNIKLSEQQIRNQFQITFEEHNPFHSIKDSHESIQSIVKKYIDASSYWQNNIQNIFDSQLLLKEGFKIDRIDLQRKGYLTIQDFVRFLNIETGTFYRNRDIILIFRRLTKESKITFEAFLEALTRRQ